MNFKLKPLVASMALLVSGAVYAAGFTPPESAPAAVERLDKALERNHNGRFAESDWFRRITLSGELTVDATLSNRTIDPDVSRFISKNSSDIALTNANLYVGAKLNDWVMANLDFVFNDPGLHGSVNNDVIRDRNVNNIDEAYLTVANFRESPVYFLAGREYVPFGHYVRHPITAPLTQLLTQTNATAAQVGFIHESGFNGSAFAFRNTVGKVTSLLGEPTRRVENGGLQIGFRQEQGDVGFNLDASMLANMADVDFVQEGLSTYTDSTKGYSLVAQGHVNDFDAEAQYVASKRFNAADIAWKTKGAKPSAWLIGAGYSFAAMGHDSRVGLNYQRSNEAAEVGVLGLPKRRWQADYALNLWKNTDLAFQYVTDKDYSSKEGGTGKSSNTGIVSLRAKFA